MRTFLFYAFFINAYFSVANIVLYPSNKKAKAVKKYFRGAPF